MNYNEIIKKKLKGYFDNDLPGVYLKNIETFEIGNIIIDVNNIIDRKYFCCGDTCLKIKTVPQKLSGYDLVYDHIQIGGDCCSEPYLFITDDEKNILAEHIEGILPYLSIESKIFIKYKLENLKGKDKWLSFCQYPLEKNKKGEITNVAKVYAYTDGRCIFRVITEENGKFLSRCAIHSYCIDKGLNYIEIKPLTCWFWPLVVVPYYDGTHLLTVHEPNTYTFTIESETYATQNCIISPNESSQYIYQTMAEEIKAVFGDEFYKELCRFAEERKEKHLKNFKN